MGFNSMFRYKNFDFSFNGRISIGNYVYNNVASGSSYSGLYASVGGLANLNRSILTTNLPIRNTGQIIFWKTVHS
jgi:iron complex outermembrane receptor protein